MCYWSLLSTWLTYKLIVINLIRKSRNFLLESLFILKVTQAWEADKRIAFIYRKPLHTISRLNVLGSSWSSQSDQATGIKLQITFYGKGYCRCLHGVPIALAGIGLWWKAMESSCGIFWNALQTFLKVGDAGIVLPPHWNRIGSIAWLSQWRRWLYRQIRKRFSKLKFKVF